MDETTLYRMEVGIGVQDASKFVRALDYYGLPLELLRTLED